MLTADVIVVGGGPAGSSCARDLVRAGAAVVVADRAVFPRDKCCAGWITPQVVQALDLDLEEYGRGRTLQPFTGFVTGAIGRREVRTDFHTTVSFGIRRSEFDEYLVQRSGARLESGVRVGTIERRGDRWSAGDVASAPCLVGAGGHFCPVARVLNPDAEGGPVVIAKEIEVPLGELDCASSTLIRPEQPALYFCSDRRGYGWCVRKGEYLNVGFGRLRDSQFGQWLAAFVGLLKERRLAPHDLPERWPGHAYRLRSDGRRTLVSDGVLLVGDAAGLAFPVSGEGILPAVESGRLAARAILAAGGRYDAQHLGSYVAELERRYGRPSRAAGAPARPRSVGFTAASWASERLLRSRWFARHVLLGRWFLHTGLPPLELQPA